MKQVTATIPLLISLLIPVASAWSDEPKNHDKNGLSAQAMMSRTTWPWMSVRRKSRPA